MGEVYSNSFLNIAATAASNGNGGLFFDRNPRLVKPCKAVVRWDNFYQGTYLCGYRDVWKHSIEEAPLGHRALVIQERFLVPRVLHFAADQLFWECGECQTYEAHPQAILANIKSPLKCRDASKLRDQDFFGPLKFCRAEDENRRDAVLGAYSIWNALVEKYSRSSLTVETDKLTALSGVAKEIRSRIHDEYAAGVWREHIIHHLV